MRSLRCARCDALGGKTEEVRTAWSLRVLITIVAMSAVDAVAHSMLH